LKATIDREDKVTFEVEYLQRKKQAAFQLLVHTESGSDLRPTDITCDIGTIANTSGKFLNLMSSPVPDVFRSMEQLLRRNRKAIIRLYFMISFGMMLAGAFMLLHPWVIQNYDFPILGTESPPTPIAIGTFIYGLLLLFPTVFAFKRMRYLELFPLPPEKKED
jgi:hypothetical protein